MTDTYTALFSQIAERGQQIFLHPTPLYPWDDIINGVRIKGYSRKLYAVAPNTFRSFHRIDKSRDGAFAVFKLYFTANKNRLVESLAGISSLEDLDGFENLITHEIRQRLKNVKPDSFKSYNKLRKPVDLYIDHLVAMAEEISPYRSLLVSLLFLPLDSIMFKSEDVFTTDELRVAGLSRRSSYGSLKEEGNYRKLQEKLAAKVQQITKDIGRPFYRVYFELIWGKRYKKKGGNLFELSV